MAQRSSLEVQNFFKRFDAFRLDHLTLKNFDFFVEELEKDGKKKKKKISIDSVLCPFPHENFRFLF